MKKRVAILKLLFLNLCAWGLALFVVFHTWAAYSEHRDRRESVDALSSEYDGRLDDYAETLARTEKIKSDKDEQVRILKERMGYSEPDETPIVILNEDE